MLGFLDRHPLPRRSDCPKRKARRRESPTEFVARARRSS
jgi:hypothetical protein